MKLQPLVRSRRLRKSERLLEAAVLLLRSREQELSRLREWNHSLQTTNFRLTTEQILAHPPESNEPTITMSSTPLYMSENEEDINWQLERELIDPKLAQQLLKELEFENSEVQFDEDYSTENFHYTT